jgi:hypothetical protein
MILKRIKIIPLLLLITIVLILITNLSNIQAGAIYNEEGDSKDDESNEKENSQDDDDKKGWFSNFFESDEEELARLRKDSQKSLESFFDMYWHFIVGFITPLAIILFIKLFVPSIIKKITGDKGIIGKMSSSLIGLLTGGVVRFLIGWGILCVIWYIFRNLPIISWFNDLTKKILLISLNFIFTTFKVPPTFINVGIWLFIIILFYSILIGGIAYKINKRYNIKNRTKEIGKKVHDRVNTLLSVSKATQDAIDDSNYST